MLREIKERELVGGKMAPKHNMKGAISGKIYFLSFEVFYTFHSSL